jgi:hypothetical protein
LYRLSDYRLDLLSNPSSVELTRITLSFLTFPPLSLVSHTRSCSSMVSRLHVQVWYGPGASASDGCSTGVRCGVPSTENLRGSERTIKNEGKGSCLLFFRSPSSKCCGNRKACCATFHLAHKTMAIKSCRECQVDWS